MFLFNFCRIGKLEISSVTTTYLPRCWRVIEIVLKYVSHIFLSSQLGSNWRKTLLDLKWSFLGLFCFILVLCVLNVPIMGNFWEKVPMNGFEPVSFDVGSDHSDNCATTIALLFMVFFIETSNLWSVLSYFILIIFFLRPKNKPRGLLSAS